MIRVAICDDEPAICLQVHHILLQISRDIGEEMDISSFVSGEEYWRAQQDGLEYDILFLDITFKRMSGIELGRRIRVELDNQHLQIIYMSGQSHYAIELFHNRPLDFLIKPLSYEKIYPVILLALKLMKNQEAVFEFQSHYVSYRIPFKDILYFRSEGRKINVHTLDQDITFYGNMQELSDRIKRHNFFCIHKSYLVNFRQISKFTNEQLTLSDNTVMTISRGRRSQVQQYYSMMQGN